MVLRRGTARRQAKRISEGKNKPHFIGSITQEVAKQMVFSILNTKPAFRVKVWGENWENHLQTWVSLA